MNFVKTSMALMAAATVLAGNAIARDDGRYGRLSAEARGSIPSKAVRGLCCSDADGFCHLGFPTGNPRTAITVSDSRAKWVMVPDDAVITEPNRAGRTMVWPVKGLSGFQSDASCLAA